MAVFLFLSCSLNRSAYAQEKGELKKTVKKYNLSVCALFKNEAGYLKEWIEYHKLI